MPNCPFCSGSEEERMLNIYTDATGWRLRRNKFPAGPIHCMVLPPTCWNSYALRSLGGLDNIKTAFGMAEDVINRLRGVSIQMVIHIGPSAGQNQSHLHWHIAQRENVLVPPSFVEDLEAIFSGPCANLVILSDEELFVAVGGIRAGQCFIVPRVREISFAKLAETVHWLVGLFNRKFMSKQGMSPDFSITLRFQDGFFYGSFIPTLHQWGSTEYLALHEGMPVLLPWPHELTAEYLRS